MTQKTQTIVALIEPFNGLFDIGQDFTEDRAVESRDIAALNIPEWAQGFWFYDIVTTTVEVDGKSVELKSEPMNKSVTYWVGGRVMDADDVAKEMPEQDLVISNMRQRKVRAVLKKDGTFRPFKKGDVILPA